MNKKYKTKIKKLEKQISELQEKCDFCFEKILEINRNKIIKEGEQQLQNAKIYAKYF